MPPRRSSNLIQKGAIDEVAATLQQLPEKPKDTWSLREAIEALKDTIFVALDRGYSYEEIAALLSSKGVKISPSSLKSYLASTRKGSADSKRTGGKRGRRPKFVESASEPLTSDAPKRRGRKPKALQSPSETAIDTPEDDTTETPELATEATPSRRRGPRSTTVRAKTAAKTTRTKAQTVAGSVSDQPRRSNRGRPRKNPAQGVF